jgi:SAM-dependent methyltransferase
MHPEAWNWLAANIRPELECSRRVLDFGGCDVNGTPRALFSPDIEYVVLDARNGPDVNIVADATRWLPPARYRSAFDVVLCTEVFEHVEHWRGILYNMWMTLKPAGICLMTCATHPRAPHSIVGVEPPPAGEWYRNVPLGELLPVMNFLFRNVRYAVHPRGDIYMRGAK